MLITSVNKCVYCEWSESETSINQRVSLPLLVENRANIMPETSDVFCHLERVDFILKHYTRFSL